MDFRAFRKLNSRIQEHLVSHKGVMLDERSNAKFNIYLFGLDSFYVELYFHRDSGHLAMLHPFDSTDKLAPYLKEIDLSTLLN